MDESFRRQHELLRSVDESMRQREQEQREQPLASYFYKNFEIQYTELKQGLQANQQIAAYCYLPANEVIRVEHVGWANPNMIVLHGLDSSGDTTVACLHMSATNLVLKVIPIEKPAKRRPIGFLGELRSPQPSAQADETDPQE